MRFSGNQCGLCRKVFCCKKCRVKHETNVHEVNINCDICNYGYLILKDIKEPLLQHLKNNHWPLHCVLCKYNFRNSRDLTQHITCSLLGFKEDSPKTPYRTPASAPILVSTEDSPILQETQLKDNINLVLKLITSTPMQRNDHTKKDFNKNDEVVTPVDHVQNVKPPDSGNSMQVTKRRVTFCEVSTTGNNETDTPEREVDEVKPKLSVKLSEQFSSGLKEACTPKRPNPSSDDQEPDLEFSTPARFDHFIVNDDDHLELATPARINYIGSNQNHIDTTEPENKSPDEFKEEIEEIMSNSRIYYDENSVKNDTQQDKTHNDNCNEKEVIKDNSTIWMSALNLSEDLLSESDKDNHSNENNIEEKSNQLAQEISKDHDSPPEFISSPPKVAYPTPILKKTTENQLRDLSVVIWSPPKAPHPSLVLKNTIVIRENDDEDSIVAHPTVNLTEPIRKEEHLEEDFSPKTHFSFVNQVNPFPILKKSIAREETIDEDKENISLDYPAISRILKMHPTPHPILKRRDVNRELLGTTENGTPIMQTNSPENKIVKCQPTPIIRRTNIHMKFQFPAHLSSTPILNMHQQPKIVKKILTQQLILQQGEANYCETSTTEMLRQINEGESISGIDKNSTSFLTRQDNFAEPQNSSRSNLWTSMTRIVKRVIQKTVSFTNDSYSLCVSDGNQLAIASTSFKRHYSESDSPEMALAPRTKRFKFTDIKCRRPIRDLSPPRPGRTLALPSTSTAAATFEMVRSVTTTAHGFPEKKVYVDKATQTDNLFML